MSFKTTLFTFPCYSSTSYNHPRRDILSHVCIQGISARAVPSTTKTIKSLHQLTLVQQALLLTQLCHDIPHLLPVTVPVIPPKPHSQQKGIGLSSSVKKEEKKMKICTLRIDSIARKWCKHRITSLNRVNLITK